MGALELQNQVCPRWTRSRPRQDRLLVSIGKVTLGIGAVGLDAKGMLPGRDQILKGTVFSRLERGFVFIQLKVPVTVKIESGRSRTTLALVPFSVPIRVIPNGSLQNRSSPVGNGNAKISRFLDRNMKISNEFGVFRRRWRWINGDEVFGALLLESSNFEPNRMEIG